MKRGLIAVLLLAFAAQVVTTSAAAAERATFRLGFKSLADLIPDIVGDPVEEEAHNPMNGDGLQHTTIGLMVWRKADNWTAFTNGYWTWVNGPNGLQKRLNTERFPWEYDDRAAMAAPPRAEPSSRGATSILAPTAQQQFIDTLAGPARTSAQETGVPASVTIAQAILETDWGQSELATRAHNFFGIKATSGPGPAGIITINTWEVIGGKNTTVQADFKAYHDLPESVADHGHFLRDRAWYADAFKTTDPREFIRRVRAGGYATDPSYADKVIAVMDRYNLYGYDR
ncbi:MAG TPA: glucosaminidase domain-containing protein [Chloroflexota bacterium]